MPLWSAEMGVMMCGGETSISTTTSVTDSVDIEVLKFCRGVIGCAFIDVASTLFF